MATTKLLKIVEMFFGLPSDMTGSNFFPFLAFVTRVLPGKGKSCPFVPCGEGKIES